MSVSHCLVCSAVGRTRRQETIEKYCTSWAQRVHGCRWKTAGLGEVSVVAHGRPAIAGRHRLGVDLESQQHTSSGWLAG